MKLISSFLFTGGLALGFSATAATTWSNCTAGPQTEAIQEVFWKSDMSGGNGPNYELPSGQTFRNTETVCKKGKVVSTKAWEHELNAGLNPAKSIDTFQSVKTSKELKDFLSEFGVSVFETKKLDAAVDAFLAGKPLNYDNGGRGPAPAVGNPTILVGASKTQAIVLLASYDGNSQSAVILQVDNK